MGVPVYMTVADSARIVTDYADLHTGGDVLEGLKQMGSEYDDLDREDQVAYTTFMRAGRQMFRLA
jgi:hypothetical protein